MVKSLAGTESAHRGVSQSSLEKQSTAQQALSERALGSSQSPDEFSLNLPFDYHRSMMCPHGYEVTSFTVPDNIGRSLFDRYHTQNALCIGSLSALIVLLHRYSGQSCVPLGIPFFRKAPKRQQIMRMAKQKVNWCWLMPIFSPLQHGPMFKKQWAVAVFFRLNLRRPRASMIRIKGRLLRALRSCKWW